jgi:hypothetical protein
MRKDFGLIFLTHLILIILAWTSGFWLDFKIIFFFIFLYYLQLIFLKDCILTKKQFKTKKRSITFYWYYLNKLGFKFKRDKVRFAADYIFPWLIFGVAIFWQVILGKNVLIGF